MGNRVHMGLRKIEKMDIDLNGIGALGPWLQIYAYDDASECTEYVGQLEGNSYMDYIREVLTNPGEALKWIDEHEGDYDGLFDWALEHGMYLMDDWYDPDELAEAYRKAREEDDE